MKQITRKLVVLFCVIALCLVGCSRASTVTDKPFDIYGAQYYKNLLGGDLHAFNFSMRDDIGGIVLTQEVWQNGTCTDTALLSSGESRGLQSYYLFLERLQDEDSHVWRGNRLTIWSVVHKDDGEIQSKLGPAEYEFPKAAQSELFDTISSSKNTKTKLEAGKSYILALWMESFGEGIDAQIRCKDFLQKDYQETLRDCNYAIVLRLDTYATEIEAEEAASHQQNINL